VQRAPYIERQEEIGSPSQHQRGDERGMESCSASCKNTRFKQRDQIERRDTPQQPRNDEGLLATAEQRRLRGSVRYRVLCKPLRRYSPRAPDFRLIYP